MVGRASPLACLVAIAVLLGGCATPSTEVIVPVDVVKVAPRDGSQLRRAQVQVTDLRKEVNLERTTIGGISMGQVVLKPPAPDLIRTVIETKADDALARRGITEAQTVLCGIRTFDIATPATPLYWDVNARIELVLRVRGHDRMVSGAATERTFVWPSAEIIARVTAEALRRVGEAAERALGELYEAAR